MGRSSPFSDGVGPAAVYFAYRSAAWLAEKTPPVFADRIAAWGGRVAYKRAHGKRRTVERNLARVVGEGPHLDDLVKAAFGSYAEYWLETFRLGRYSHDELLGMVEPVGDSVEVIEQVIARGGGGLLITPHLGFYDLGVAWVGAKGWAFTTVAEVLRPKALFDWFAEIRQRHGLTVLPARNGRSVRERLADVLDAGGMVALVSDRDLGRRGIWVEFFGERTTFPASPTLLLVKKKVPLIAGSVTRHGAGFRLKLERVPYELTGDEQADIRAVAQITADALQRLILEAPEQWHLFSTNWPSDEPHLRPRGTQADPQAVESPGEPPQIGEPQG
ncbi:MAG TPA: phosphatidylinositol mannoside acyltransferase [Actinomycetota bacterium]|nr:phosphatidylinositol mannoside acyltransferase [Actinomycetota bacterium]